MKLPKLGSYIRILFWDHCMVSGVDGVVPILCEVVGKLMATGYTKKSNKHYIVVATWFPPEQAMDHNSEGFVLMKHDIETIEVLK